MEHSKIENIILNYINGNATPSEIAELSEAMKDKETRELFESYIQVNHVLDIEYNSVDSKKALSKFNKFVDEEGVRKIDWYRKSYEILKYAALIIVFIGISFTIHSITKTRVDIEGKIIVEMDNGSNMLVYDASNRDIINSNGKIVGIQKEGMIVYNSWETNDDNIPLFNKLIVPNGQNYRVRLSDGTLVHLNSGSTLKYPVKFIKGRSRIVELKGEASFEVAKDKHDSFIVRANDISTKVYGTKFVVSSYPNDSKQFVVLIEGSVGVSINNIEKMIIPNQKATFNNKSKELEVIETDVTNFTAWEYGVLKFDNERFDEILKDLERHYNVSIVSSNEELNKIKFTGTFDTETIDQVLKSFQKYKPFSYTLINNKIIINH